MYNLDLNGPDLDTAFKIAIREHDGQFRKGSGVPYIKHVLDVAERLHIWGFPKEDFPHLWAIAYLHDVLEDSKDPKAAAKSIIDQFDPLIYNKVRELTFDPSKQTKQAYIDGFVNASPEALVVKFADRYCNTMDFINSGDYKYACKYFHKFDKAFDGINTITTTYGIEKAKKIGINMVTLKNLLEGYN